jgi:hypothetical protein
MLRNNLVASEDAGRAFPAACSTTNGIQSAGDSLLALDAFQGASCPSQPGTLCAFTVGLDQQ